MNGYQDEFEQERPIEELERRGGLAAPSNRTRWIVVAIVAAAFLWLSATPGFSQPKDYTPASSLLADCVAAEQAKANPNTFNAYRSGWCTAYISGIADTLTILPKNDIYAVCLKDTTRGQLVQVFMAFVKIYPERLHHDVRYVVIDAFNELFKCGSVTPQRAKIKGGAK